MSILAIHLLLESSRRKHSNKNITFSLSYGFRYKNSNKRLNFYTQIYKLKQQKTNSRVV